MLHRRQKIQLMSMCVRTPARVCVCVCVCVCLCARACMRAGGTEAVAVFDYDLLYTK